MLLGADVAGAAQTGLLPGCNAVLTRDASRAIARLIALKGLHICCIVVLRADMAVRLDGISGTYVLDDLERSAATLCCCDNLWGWGPG